jgi:hypothetical protein
MTIPRFIDPAKQNYLRDLARGRPGAASEMAYGRLGWWPTINGERIPDERAPFATQKGAKDAARDFKERCRAELAAPNE